MRQRLTIFDCLMLTSALTLIVAAGCRSHQSGEEAARSASAKITVASATVPPATNPSDEARAVHLSTSAATAPTTQAAQSYPDAPVPQIATVFGDFNHTPLAGQFYWPFLLILVGLALFALKYAISNCVADGDSNRRVEMCRAVLAVVGITFIERALLAVGFAWTIVAIWRVFILRI